MLEPSEELHWCSQDLVPWFCWEKGNVLDKGLRSITSVGTFLCQFCAEEKEAIHGLDALI